MNVLGVVAVDDDDDGPVRLVLDWAVDGVRLRQLLHRRSGRPVEEDAAMWPPSGAHVVDLLRGDLEEDWFGPGRVPILTCSQSDDFECGAVTMRVVTTAERVCWSDFRWQEPLYRDPEDLGESLAPVGLTFSFDHSTYDRFLYNLLAWVEAQPVPSVPAVERRRWFRFGR